MRTVVYCALAFCAGMIALRFAQIISEPETLDDLEKDFAKCREQDEVGRPSSRDDFQEWRTMY